MRIFPANNIASMTNYYNGLKIKHKFFLTNLVIVVTVCLVCLTIIQITQSIYQRTIYDEVAKELNLSAISVENELSQIEGYSFQITTDSDIQMLLDKLKTDSLDHKMTQNGRKLSDRLWSMTFERNIISVNIIDSQGRQYSGGVPISQGHIRDLVGIAAKKKGAMVFVEPINDSYILCVRQIRKIRDLDLGPLGTLIIRVNTPSLIKQTTAGSMDNSISLIVRSNKKIVHVPSPALQKINKQLTFRGETGYQINRIEGQNYFVSHIRSNYTNWEYINILPYQAIFKRISIMRNIVLVVFVTLVLFVLLISMKFAKNLTTPIEDLSLRMKQVQEGNFSINSDDMIPTKRLDEIGDLEKDFNIMVNKINDLINENYIKQILIKEAQLKALRANINPHFLYNTLESINWLAKTNRQVEISLVAESLGRLLRNAISDRNHLATIKEEIQLLNDYITIQKIRFKERLDFNLAIDRRWYDINIPRLSIQPLVENSIIYGLEKKPGTCNIEIHASENQDSLLIIVKDNGPGIPVDVLAKIKTWQYEPNGLGIGLKNIDDRFRLIYGDRYGIDIESQSGAWTKVTLRIPLTGDGHV